MTRTGDPMSEMNLNVLRYGTRIGDSLLKKKVSLLTKITFPKSTSIGGYSQAMTKEEQIRKLEEELEALKVKQYSKTSDTYGKGNNLEEFSMKHLNRRKDKDLMPCPRRPPKKSS